MSSREERMARNEAASRRSTRRSKRPTWASHPQTGSTSCECARLTCDAAIDITLDEYGDVREDARLFVVFPGHFVGDIEWIVYENDRFAVVAKREEFRQRWRGTEPARIGRLPQRRSHRESLLIE